MKLPPYNSIIVLWYLKMQGYLPYQTCRYSSSLCALSHKENDIHLPETVDRGSRAEMVHIYKASEHLRDKLNCYSGIIAEVKLVKKYRLPTRFTRLIRYILNQQRCLWLILDLSQNHWQNDCCSILSVDPSHLILLRISKTTGTMYNCLSFGARIGDQVNYNLDTKAKS